MSNPKISVIIPVYNVADYLDESLNSILNQTMIDDIEVIMVDDGSTDDSRYIVEDYALDYDNFQAHHKENGGAGVARNYGLQFAKGEYIHFMDPDDYINPQAYEKMYNLAIANDCDVVIGNAVRYDRYKIWDENLFKQSFKDFDDDLMINSVNERLSILWDTVLWNKLFRTDFVNSNDIRFPNQNVIYQDIPFTLKSYVLANSIYITQEVMYYWRLRKKSRSSTQLYENIKTFYDRIKILDISEKLMNEMDVNDDIRNYEYKKWLNHDLKLFLKRLTKFSDEYYGEIISNVHRIIKDFPCEFIDDLNSYKKVMYKMVENDDLDSLIKFSYLEKDLMLNPAIPDTLDEKYHEFIDFKRDGEEEELNIVKNDIISDDKNIRISFKHNINYVAADYPHEIKAVLVENQNEHDLKVVGDEIVFPIDLIKDMDGRLHIRASYISEDFNKQSYLQSKKRNVIRFDGFDLEFGIGVNKALTINVRKTNTNMIEIKEILFEDNEFRFVAKSNFPIENIVLENVITFDRLEYPVLYRDNSFTFTVPYADICANPIRKWEIKTDSVFNSIKLAKKVTYYKKSNRILFLNARNKILIEEDIYNKYDELDRVNDDFERVNQINMDLKEINNDLKRENRMLEREKIRLTNKVDEYNSRKVVRFADKIKGVK